METKTITVTVAGPEGSGKSGLIDLIRRRLEWIGRPGRTEVGYLGGSWPPMSTPEAEDRLRALLSPGQVLLRERHGIDPIPKDLGEGALPAEEPDWIPAPPTGQVTRWRFPMGFAGTPALTQARVEELRAAFVDKGWNLHTIHLHPDEMKAYEALAFGKERIVLAGSDVSGTPTRRAIFLGSKGKVVADVQENTGARLEKHYFDNGDVTLVADAGAPLGYALVDVVAGLPELRELGPIEQRELARVAWNAMIQHQRTRGGAVPAWGEIGADAQALAVRFVKGVDRELTSVSGVKKALFGDIQIAEGWSSSVYLGILRALVLAEAS